MSSLYPISTALAISDSKLRILEHFLACEDSRISHLGAEHPQWHALLEKRELYASAQRKLEYVLARAERKFITQILLPGTILNESATAWIGDIQQDLKDLGWLIEELKDELLTKI